MMMMMLMMMNRDDYKCIQRVDHRYFQVLGILDNDDFDEDDDHDDYDAIDDNNYRLFHLK